MKLAVTIVPINQTVTIDVEPGIYNRAVKGSAHFQDTIIDLTKEQLPRGVPTDLTWDAIAVSEPGEQ
jgi:hypothetical protein